MGLTRPQSTIVGHKKNLDWRQKSWLLDRIEWESNAKGAEGVMLRRLDCFLDF